jgi:hypothetical protein
MYVLIKFCIFRTDLAKIITLALTYGKDNDIKKT